jgi:prolyl oligopeptidase
MPNYLRLLALFSIPAALAACVASGRREAPLAGPAVHPPDPYAWLEDVTGERAMAWVRERNADSARVLAVEPAFSASRSRLLGIMDSTDKIPAITRIGGHVYNLWRDETHKRGLWRRTTLADYAQPRPAWEPVLDLDALGRTENENWVWSGATCLSASTEATKDRCMIALSRGGADASVNREFDLATRQFVAGGFTLPEAKTQVEWIDRDTLFVGTDFGPGSMTESGYARLVKEWKRGTPLSAARTVLEAHAKDVYAFADVDRTPGYERRFLGRAKDFYRTELFLQSAGKLVPIDKPIDALFWAHRQWAFLQPRSPYTVDGKTYPSGSLLAMDFDAYMRGERNFQLLFEPTPSRALVRGGIAFTRTRVLLTVQDNVASRIEELHPVDGRWQRREVKSPFPGRLSVSSLHDSALAEDELAESYLVNYEDFLTPATLSLARTGSDDHQALKRAPVFFEAQGMKVEQQFAASKDGTRVPYFVVLPKGAVADGTTPTVLYGYGGFEISQRPFYTPAFGSAWLAQGGALVVANIRGGGEFGPEWHTAAVKADKQRSYDDFIAVAQDLAARRVTSAKHLGIMGGSNGGLLVGAVFTQRPELFNAVVCQVPLLDMARFHKLLAGASWMAEYGDPDQAEQWAYLSRYSPYHNVKADVVYPQVLFTTSTRDDRVHPAHARKMAARMLEQGHQVLYYENIEGGHGGAADNAQRANLQALEFSYLWQRLGPRLGPR